MRPPVRETSRRFTRHEEIRRVIQRLQWRGYPRLQMLLIVSITGLCGLAASYGMYHSGVTSMATRYPLAVVCAYAVFLVLLWLWLRTRPSDYGDIDFPSSGRSGGVDGPPFSGRGGQSGGGGASGNFDDALPSPDVPSIDIPGGEALGDAVGAADEVALPLLVVILLAAIGAVLLFSTLYIVYMAPALFAELLVDGLLSASLYHRLRGLQTRHWLESALRRTALPFLLTGLSLGALGLALHAYAPEAATIGQVLEHRASRAH